MTQHSPLRRLIYVSAFSPVFPREREEQDYVIAAIVRASIRNNGENGVTGLLLVHQRHFLQALEGSAEAVQGLYERIQQDRRHTNLRLIGLDRCDRRQFPDWSMSARRATGVDGAVLGDLDRAHATDPSALGPDAALNLLIAAREARARVVLAAMA
jgi:hypothetical protein